MKAAHLYVQLGWRVVPLHSIRNGTCTCGHVKPPGGVCECGTAKCPVAHGPGSSGKHPRLRDWVNEASAEPATIAEWAGLYPDANLGIATGSASEFFVLDVDPKNGGDTTLAALLAEHGPLPRTPQQATPSGGAHYLFRMPPGRAVSNAKIGRGLDIRGDGGQIVAAPSVTVGQYRWTHAPWEVPLADAPSWLLERLGKGPAAVAARPDESARGYFPPASPAVLEAAREAIEAHGPAVDGDAGGLHTVHAAAILTHDFALTDEEAWPLFQEWNAGCVPPWEPDELRVRLERGRKYGKAEYGCKRTLDVVEAVRKAIQEWQASSTGEPGMYEMIETVRRLVSPCADTARRAVIEREMRAATGLGVRALALPKPSAEAVPLKQGEIRVSPQPHETADEALRAIAPHVFARNGVLCKVVRAERTFVQELDVPAMVDVMSRTAKFVRHDENKGAVIQAPPELVARMLCSSRTHPGVRVLEAVTSAPIFLADGTVLQERGYNAQARVFLEPNVSVVVPEAPTREDAREAVTLFRDLVSDFRFAQSEDFSSWLAAVLSPLVKAATGNAPAPLVCVTASTPGAGKTLLTEVVARIVTGAPPEVRPYSTKDASEHQKRLTAFVLAGSPVSVFDNVNGEFGDEHLDRLLTSTTWSDRQLGASQAPAVPIVSTWLATGNNLEPRGDTVRRVLMVRLEVLEDKPQCRTGFRRPQLAEYAQENRAELLSAALTILRAYHCAGRPDMKLPAWGSFTAWSALVRGALVWAGCADPFKTQERAAAELGEADESAHDFWIDTVSASDGTPSGIAVLANQRGAQETLGTREPLTPYRLRLFLGRYVDKPRLGKRIRKTRDSRGVVSYRVEWIQERAV